ncbi:VOC family protein [Nocardia brasiliensis]
MSGPTIHGIIATLVYQDIAAAHDFLATAFGLKPGRIDIGDDGTAHHGEVSAGEGTIWLHRTSREFNLRSPLACGSGTASISIVVDDVDAHYEHAKAAGAEIVYGPIDQAYGFRDYSAYDPEKQLWTFMSPLD